jgi:hypothetical protein
MLRSMWGKDTMVGMRARADLSVSRGLVSRGELQRELLLSNLGVQDIPEEGVEGAKAFRVSFKQSKTNQFGNQEQAGCLRFYLYLYQDHGY